MGMNEQPQQDPDKKLPLATPPEQQLYQPAEQPSAYAGYDLTSNSDAQPTKAPADTEISWEAVEYVHHTKNAGWFILFALGMLSLAAIAVLIGAWTFVAVVAVMSVALVMYAVRPPRTLRYTLNENGLQVGEKSYEYAEFRAFGVVTEATLYSVMLIPAKRFMPAVTIYFNEQDGEKIVDILGGRLPMQEITQDPFEKIVRRLRF